MRKPAFGLLPAVWLVPLVVQANPNILYLNRIGMYNTREFMGAEGYAHSDLAVGVLPQRDFLPGFSHRYAGSQSKGYAAWVANTQTGLTTRLGFFGTSEFASSDGYESSSISKISGSGFCIGYSSRFKGTLSLGGAAWVANTMSGLTTRIGLYGTPEFTNSSGLSGSSSEYLTESGFLAGFSSRFSGSEETGLAAWVADADSGITRRVGLYGTPEFTATNGFEDSRVHRLTESGFLSGHSYRKSESSSDQGIAEWVADARTGSTARIGLFNSPEYVSASGYALSETNHLTESGVLAGYSLRFGMGLGRAAWMANARTGTTSRLGLWDTPEFTRSDGYSHSDIRFVTESGFIAGQSERVHDDLSLRGEAAWVVDAANGATIRVGFYNPPEYIAVDKGGMAFSLISHLTETGLFAGNSSRYDGIHYLGEVVWVGGARTGSIKRVGFYDPPELSDLGGSSGSYVWTLTESGFLAGASQLFGVGEVAWTANAASGTTTRVGLYGTSEFSDSQGKSYSVPTHGTESGYVTGSSFRFNNGSDELGQAAWVADAKTGSTTRVGLYDSPEFTSSEGRAYSNPAHVSESGYVTGGSTRFNGGSTPLGNASWVADVRTGITTRVGLYGTPVFTAPDGTSSSGIGAPTKSGLIAGGSMRYTGEGRLPGVTSWVFDAKNQEQIVFDLSIRPSDGYANSMLWGITEDGVAYGEFSKFIGETDMGLRAFIWTRNTGTLVLDESIAGGVQQYGWKYLLRVIHVGENGLLVGYGRPLNATADGIGVFLARIVPEPATPPGLHIEIAPSGSSAVVTFVGGILQESPDGTLNSFTDLPGVTSPYIVPGGSPEKYFRVRK